MIEVVAAMLVATASADVGPGAIARAAGSEAIVFEGPGLHRPLEVAFRNSAAINQFELAAQMGAWFNAYAEDVQPLLPEAPTDDLGARWTATWTSLSGRSTKQYLYPDAAGGLLVHTPDGQNLWEGAVGWFRAPGELIDTLRLVGVPIDSDCLLAVG